MSRQTIATLAWAVFIVVLLIYSHAFPRDLDGRYAQSPLKPWFDGLKANGVPCCSDADGTAVAGPDWEVVGGRYRVRLEGQWVDVPPEAVITEPNRAGQTMVWPIYYRSLGAITSIKIRCFLPGEMG